MTDSATFTTPEAGDEEMCEELGSLDYLLASTRSDEEPTPKRGRKPKGSGIGVSTKQTFVLQGMDEDFFLEMGT